MGLSRLTGGMRNLWSRTTRGKPDGRLLGPEAKSMHLFATEAYAQSTIGGTAGGGGLMGGLAGIGQFLPIVLIFIVFYFLLIRPQQQRQKSLKTMVAALKRGDRVVTAGGIVGVVQKVREGTNEIEVEIAPNVRVQILRETISSVVKPPGAANDSVPATTKAKE